MVIASKVVERIPASAIRAGASDKRKKSSTESSESAPAAPSAAS